MYKRQNLYRPKLKTDRKVPAILNPHGHWAEGRLVNRKEGSVPARCINFAKRGMVAFAYDMFGSMTPSRPVTTARTPTIW